MIATLVLAACAASSSVTVGSRAMKTHPFSDPDPVPRVDEKSYPYFRFEGPADVGVTQAWRTVALENGLVRVTLFPELGGKALCATNLPAAGGIEFDVGTLGPAPFRPEPVDWFVRTNGDASVSCFLAANDYGTRSRSEVEVTIRPGASAFETRTDSEDPDALLRKAISLRGTDAFRPFTDEVLAKHPLFHAVRFLRDRHGFRAYVRCAQPDETFLELGSWFESEGRRADAAVLFACASNSPVARIRLAFLHDDAAALAEIAKLPVAGVRPFRRESLAALAWAAEKGNSWKFHYYQGVLLAALGRKAESARELDLVDEADEGVVFLFRATQRTGKARRADLIRARRIDPSWRAGRAICEYYEATGEYAAMLRESRRWIERYPANPYIRALHEKALRRNDGSLKSNTKE